MEFAIAEASQPQVTVGVDTHKQFHVAHAVDALGCSLGSQRIPASSQGYHEFTGWAQSLRRLVLVGIEGAGHYGAGLARHLHEAATRSGAHRRRKTKKRGNVLPQALHRPRDVPRLPTRRTTAKILAAT
jgi:transposase